jgi:hypothetical protein
LSTLTTLPLRIACTSAGVSTPSSCGIAALAGVADSIGRGTAETTAVRLRGVLLRDAVVVAGERVAARAGVIADDT